MWHTGATADVIDNIAHSIRGKSHLSLVVRYLLIVILALSVISIVKCCPLSVMLSTGVRSNTMAGNKQVRAPGMMVHAQE